MGPLQDDASGEGKKESAPASPASPSMSTAPVHEEVTIDTALIACVLRSNSIS